MSSNNFRKPTRRGIISVVAMFGFLGAIALVASAQDRNAPAKVTRPPSVASKKSPKSKATRQATSTQPTTEKDKSGRDAKGQTPASALGAKIVIDEPNHDFGSVWIGEVLEHTFEVRNEGVTPLELIKVKPSCGCTVAKGYDKVIEPGAVGKIPVSINTSKLNGKFSKSIRVTSSDASNSQVNLSIKGTVNHYIITKPRRASFGSIKPNGEKTQVIKLTNNSGKPLELTLGKKDITPFTAELVEKVEGQEYELLIHAKPPFKEGRSGVLVEVQTNIPQQKVLRISTSVVVVARLEVKPNLLLIPRPRDKAQTKKIIITNNGDTPVHLLEATTNDELLTLETKEVQAGKVYEVLVSMPAGYFPEGRGKKIDLKFDDSQKPLVSIPVTNRRVRSGTKPAQKLQGQLAPKAEFVTHGGVKIDTTNIQDEALVLKFYATWCGFCKKSLPGIETVHQKFKDKGVRFIAMNQDNPNDPKRSKAFTPEQGLAKLKSLGVTFDVAFDPQKNIGKLFKATSYPTMFLISKTGKIAEVYVGAITGTKIRAFSNDIEKLLAAQEAAKTPATAAETFSTGTN